MNPNVFRGLNRAERLLGMAKGNLRVGYHHKACFMAVRAARVALHTFLSSKNSQPVEEHSIEKLARLCLQHDQAFGKAVEAGQLLDHYYNRLASGEAKSEAGSAQIRRVGSDAVALATAIITLVRSKLTRKNEI